VTDEEFTELVVDRELEDGRYISLLDNKIVFDECTKFPHREIIMEIGAQISLQDRAAGSFFIAGTGNRITIYKAYIKTLLLLQALATRHPMATGNSPRQESLRNS
jgi:hypothetical protein